MTAPLPSADAPKKSVFVWPLRVLICFGAVYISFWLIMPALGGTIGLIIAAVFAAAALGAEMWLTSRLREQNIETVAAQRMIAIDRIFSAPDDSLAHRHGTSGELEEAEIVDAEVIDSGDDRPELWS